MQMARAKPSFAASPPCHLCKVMIGSLTIPLQRPELRIQVARSDAMTAGESLLTSRLEPLVFAKGTKCERT